MASGKVTRKSGGKVKAGKLAAPAKASSAIREARIDLACALRWAARFGLNEGVCNHFSLAVPGTTDRYLLNPHGVLWSDMSASDLLVVDAEGRLIEGKHAMEATAFFIHSRIHRARPDAAAVLHTHMPYATALTSLEGGRLEMVTQNSLRYVGMIAYDEDEGGYRGLALDDAEGDRMARALLDKRILFLANHGVVVVGPDVATAFDDLYYLERAAMVQVMAAMTGRKLKHIGDNLARETFLQMESCRIHYAHTHFTALRNKLDKDEPAYKR